MYFFYLSLNKSNFVDFLEFNCGVNVLVKHGEVDHMNLAACSVFLKAHH